MDSLLIAKLNKKLESLDSGVILLLQIINQAELEFLLDDCSDILQIFSQLIQNLVEQYFDKNDFSIVLNDTHYELYIILPQNKLHLIANTETFAYELACQIQLYFEPEISGVSLNCAAASMQFTTQSRPHIDKALKSLQYLLYLYKDQCFYLCYEDYELDPSLVKRENDELNMLRKCLKEERVKFSYQPIIDRKTGGVEYYECLLRIENHHGEYVSIGSLIEKAEAKGLANIIDFTVIEMVTKELIRNPSLVLSVNISNMGLLNKALGNKIEQIFIEHKIAPRLIIEITETSLNHDFHNSKIFLDKLRKYGCKFALDDFGSGFTAFNQLLNLPIDIIKIDGTYIKNILDNKYNRYFVEALISMAGDLGIKTVAEYVENDAIAKFLIEAKIDSMQGHFFFPASEYKIGEISE